MSVHEDIRSVLDMVITGLERPGQSSRPSEMRKECSQR